MSLDAALGIASSGLLAVQRALAQAGSNVANANTAGYTAKSLPLQSRDLGPGPAGVATAEAQRAVDAALVRQIGSASADQAAATLRERLLKGIETAYGGVTGVDSQGSLAEDVNALRAAFTSLQASPEDAALQRAVVAAAQKVANGFNAVGAAIGDARQQAQDEINNQVGIVNGALRQIGALNQQVMLARQQGRSTAELEDQRDQAVQTLSGALKVRTVQQADGSLLVMGAGGVLLPTDPKQDALSVGGATVAPGAFHGGAGTLPGVMLNGLDVTRQLTGGTLGEAIVQRDQVLPRYQAELDNAAGTMAWRFDQEGLTLFADASGAVPDMAQPYVAGGQLGFANLVQVNPAVLANPALVRDGDHAVPGFTPNPAGGPAGFSAMIERVVNFTFGKESASGTPWVGIPSGGLGPDGSLGSPFNPPPGLTDYAATIQSVHANNRAVAAAAKDQAGGVVASLQQRFNTQSGVNVDAEMTNMIRLQQAYAANARVVGSVQQMWDALLGAVR